MQLVEPLQILGRELLGSPLRLEFSDEEQRLRDLLAAEDSVERALDLCGLDAVEWAIVVRAHTFDGRVGANDYLGALRAFSGGFEAVTRCPRFVCKYKALAAPFGWDAVPLRGDYAKAFAGPPDAECWRELLEPHGARGVYNRVREVYQEAADEFRGYAEAIATRQLELRVAIWMLRTQCLLLDDVHARTAHAVSSVETYLRADGATDVTSRVVAPSW